MHHRQGVAKLFFKFFIAAGASLWYPTTMRVHTVPLGPIETNAYLLCHEGAALLIDAPPGSEALLPELERLGVQLEAIWLTHAHYDHTLGIMAFKDVPVYAHPDGKLLLEHPEVMGRHVEVPAHWSTQALQYSLQGGQTLNILGQNFEVRDVPGHCPGSVLFYHAVSNQAFVGDAIFQNSVGRTDLPLANFDTLEGAIRTQIYTLPDSCTLLPGHGPATTVSHEKHHNPYVRP